MCPAVRVRQPSVADYASGFAEGSRGASPETRSPEESGAKVRLADVRDAVKTDVRIVR
jgi:hypothetical protein